MLIVAGLKRLKAGKVGDFVREYATLANLLVTGALRLAAWLVNQTAYNVQKAATGKLFYRS